MSVLIIHPSDVTTNFLNEIVDYLKETAVSSLIEYFVIEPNDGSHEKCKERLKVLEIGSSVFFLGHGTSYALVGARNDGYYRKEFITKDDFALLHSKNLFFLSCRSAEFLRTLNSIHEIPSIGFGDLPTEWDEILGAREYEQNAYKGITQDVLDQFKSFIVDIAKYSLEDALVKNLTMKELYLRIKLRINKRIYTVVKNGRSPEARVLSNLLYDMKNELVIYGNFDTKLLK